MQPFASCDVDARGKPGRNAEPSEKELVMLKTVLTFVAATIFGLVSIASLMLVVVGIFAMFNEPQDKDGTAIATLFFSVLALVSSNVFFYIAERRDV
jgi:hypothetical protein